MWCKRIRLLGAALLVALYTGLVAQVAQDPTRAGGVWRNLSPFVWLFQGVPVEATYIPTALKSAQYFDTSFGGTTSTTATITAVDTNYAIVCVLGAGDFASDDSLWGFLQLTNGTTVTETRTKNSGATPLTWAVVEAVPQLVKARGFANTTLSTIQSTNTGSVGTVVATKTLACFSGAIDTSTGGVFTWGIFVGGLSSTVVTVRRLNSGGNSAFTVYYSWFEFK